MARDWSRSVWGALFLGMMHVGCSGTCDSSPPIREDERPVVEEAPDWLTVRLRDAPEWQYVGDSFNASLLVRVDGAVAPFLNPSITETPTFVYTVAELGADANLDERFEMREVGDDHFVAPVRAKCVKVTEFGRLRAVVDVSWWTTEARRRQNVRADSEFIECRERPDPPKETFNAGVIGPERLFRIPNTWGNIEWGSDAPHVLGVAGAGGLAVVDPASGEVLLESEEEPSLLGGVAFEAKTAGTQGIPTHDIAVYGNDGWRKRTLGWSPMPALIPPNTSPSGGKVFDVSGWGEADLAPGAVVVGSETFQVYLVEYDSLSGYRSNFDLMTDADDFPDVEGGITSAWLGVDESDMAEFPILAVAQGSSADSPGALYKIDKTFFGALNGSRVGATGTDPRTIRCVESSTWLCAISNFTADSITIAFRDGDDVTIGPEHAVGDGPIDLYIQSVSTDSAAVFTAGFNDDTLHRHIIDVEGESIDAASVALPDGCLEPNGVVPVDDSLTEMYVACSGSDRIAVVTMPAF